MCVQSAASVNVVESSSTFDDGQVAGRRTGRYAVTRNVLRVLNRTPRGAAVCLVPVDHTVYKK